MQTPENKFQGSESHRADDPKDSFWPSKREKQIFFGCSHLGFLPTKQSQLLGKHKIYTALPRTDLTAFIVHISWKFSLKLCWSRSVLRQTGLSSAFGILPPLKSPVSHINNMAGTGVTWINEKDTENLRFVINVNTEIHIEWIFVLSKCLWLSSLMRITSKL